MRCGPARKRMSDELDGELARGGKKRLGAHLRTCPACRTYGEGLGRIQAGAELPDIPHSGSWAAFERSLNGKLAAAEAGRASVGVPFAARRRWAWAAAAVMVLAGGAVWYAFLRPGSALPETWAAYEDVLDPIVRAAETNPELARRVDGEVRALIDEAAPAPDADAAVLPAEDPLFWEGLSDDDLRAIVTELEDETGRGGPQ